MPYVDLATTRAERRLCLLDRYYFDICPQVVLKSPCRISCQRAGWHAASALETRLLSDLLQASCGTASLRVATQLNCCSQACSAASQAIQLCLQRPPRPCCGFTQTHRSHVPLPSGPCTSSLSVAEGFEHWQQPTPCQSHANSSSAAVNRRGALYGMVMSDTVSHSAFCCAASRARPCAGCS